MSDKDDDPKTWQQNDINLGGLFGSLGSAITEMVSRLEEGKSGEVLRDLTFDTDKGPVRAQTGIRIRMGGLDGTPHPATRKTTNPINPDRPARNRPTQPPNTRELTYDVFEVEGGWRLSADLPGVTDAEIKLREDNGTLVIETTGVRHYLGRVALDRQFSIEDIRLGLRNGILDLQIPLAGEP